MENGVTIIDQTKLPEEVQKLVTESGLDHTKAQTYIAAFVPYMNKLSELEENIKLVPNENITPEIAKEARLLRLQYVPNRTAAEKKKDELKKNVLIESNLIQSMFNVILNASKMKEEYLKGIEEHYERQQAAEKAKIKTEREALLSHYVDNVSIYPLGEITQEAFDQLLQGQKLIKAQKEKEAQMEAKQLERANLLAPFTEAIPKTILETISGKNLGLAILEEADWNDLFANAKAACEEMQQNKMLAQERQFQLLELGVTKPLADIEKMNAAQFLEEHSLAKINFEATKEAERLAQEKEAARIALQTERYKAIIPFIIPQITDVKLETLWSLHEAEWDIIFGEVKETFEEDKKQKQAAIEQAAKEKAEAEAEKKSRMDKLSKYDIRYSPSELDSIMRMKPEGFETYLNTLEEGKKRAERLALEEVEAAMGDSSKMQQLIGQIIEPTKNVKFKSKRFQEAHTFLCGELEGIVTKINSNLNKKAK